MKKTLIIAEAGVNHNGRLDIAKRLIDVAAEAGADAVKFQTFKSEMVISRYAPKAAYQKATTNALESQLDMAKKLELNVDKHRELIRHCKSKSIVFLSTPFDLDSVSLLCKLRLSVFKIPSGEITNLPYLRKIGKLNKKIILSSGMAKLQEIDAALKILITNGTPKNKITVLHCNTEYPTPMGDVNLLAMLAIRRELGVAVGYSDHTLGIEIPIAAVALGATIIEKHFTLDNRMDGPDHKASLEPHELKAMVKSIRNVERAMGDGIKKPSRSEFKNIRMARKSIVAATEIRQGELFSDANITAKRPGTGISPMLWDRIIGKPAGHGFRKDELIRI